MDISSITQRSTPELKQRLRDLIGDGQAGAERQAIIGELGRRAGGDAMLPVESCIQLLAAYQTEEQRSTLLSALPRTTLERLQAHYASYNPALFPDGQVNCRLIAEAIRMLEHRQRSLAMLAIRV